jgi:hypothetical protein
MSLNTAIPVPANVLTLFVTGSSNFICQIKIIFSTNVKIVNRQFRQTNATAFQKATLWLYESVGKYDYLVPIVHLMDVEGVHLHLFHHDLQISKIK